MMKMMIKYKCKISGPVKSAKQNFQLNANMIVLNTYLQAQCLQFQNGDMDKSNST